MSSLDFHGYVTALSSPSGARAYRVVHPAGQTIKPHKHEWPTLTVHVLGSFSETWADGEFRIGGPAVILHPAGSCHANRISQWGLETISIQFDWDLPRTLGMDWRIERPGVWIGGRIAAIARRLARIWAGGTVPEQMLAEAFSNFLRELALAPPDPAAPRWLGQVVDALEAGDAPTTEELARRLDLHPVWLRHAYRATQGEGISETRRRKCVERATRLLRTTDFPAAQIALEAGFCDQSHMNRSLRALMGRTPLQVRVERDRFGGI